MSHNSQKIIWVKGASVGKSEQILTIAPLLQSRQCKMGENFMKRIWGIRHIRFLYHSIRLERHLARCRSVGFGFFPQKQDIDFLEDVLKGKR